MPPEFLIALGGAFVLGSAIGSAGTLFAQWIVGRFSRPDNAPRRALEPAEFRLLRADMHDITRHVHNLDARMEFTERLLGGSLTSSPPPSRLETPLPQPDAEPELDDGSAQESDPDA